MPRKPTPPTASTTSLKIFRKATAMSLTIMMPAGMIVNELLTNVFKYAFPDGHGGGVRITVTGQDGKGEILAEDSCVRLSDGGDLEHLVTLGLQLIHGLISQLGGQVSLEHPRCTLVGIYMPVPIQA